MKQQIRECMSALLDNEADELDLQRILNDLERDEGSADTWRRYHLASSAMRGELDSFSDIDLSSRIQGQLAGQAGGGVEVKPARSIGSWVKPFASVAVAASVTAVILTSTQLYNSVGGDTGASPAALVVNGNVSPLLSTGQVVGFGASNVAGPMSMSPQDQILADDMAQRRLNAYLHSNIENASLNTSSGLMPYARAAALQER